jgi:hypothetical protein
VPQTVHNRLSAWVQNSDVKERLVASVGGTRQEAERFINHALVSFQTPEILACTPASQLKALFELAALGLLPNLGQAALIVWRQQEGPSIVTVLAQWQGYQALMTRHPAILDVEAHLVHVNDAFKYINGQLRHSYDPFDEARIITTEADIRGGYLTITYRDGRPPKYHFVTVAQIVKARSCAQKKEIWVKWFAEQALKTVYRNAYARRAVPIDPMAAVHLEQVTQTEDAMLRNDPTRVAEPSQLPPPKPMSKVEQMATALDSPSFDVLSEETGTDLAPDTFSQVDPAASEPLNQEQQAAFSGEQWQAAVNILTTVKSCQEFQRDILQTIPELIRAEVLATVQARIKTIKAARGENSNGTK